MSVKASWFQIGLSNTANLNFHWRNLLDGVLRLTRGNAGAPITDVMLVTADNSVEFPGGVVDPRTWKDRTASRALATTYTNTDKFERWVDVWALSTGLNANLVVSINGVDVYSGNQAHVAGATCIVSFPVGPGESYAVRQGGAAPITKWMERAV